MNHKREIISLTGLRGWAAVLVALYHFDELTPTFSLKSRLYVPRGYLAVDAFFILSGFVMAYNYPSLKLGITSGRTYLNFLIKRFARVYPAYWLALIVFAAKGVFNVSGDGRPQVFGFADWLASLGMATGWGLGVRPIVGTSWSVSAEILCYVAFPIIAAVALSSTATRRLGLLIAAILGLIFVAQSGLGAQGELDVVTYDSFFPALRAFSGFSLGCLVLSQVRDLSAKAPVVMDIVAAVGGSLALLFIVTGWSDVAAVASFAILIAGLSFDGPLARLLCGNKAALFLGNVSYSLYLIHQLFDPFVQRIVAKLDHGQNSGALFWLGVCAYLMLSIGTAAIMYSIAEKGARKVILTWVYGRRLTPSIA